MRRSPETPALPWTESVLRRARPITRLRVQQAWERLPRRWDLAHPRRYLEGLRLHRMLFAGGFTMLYPLRARTLLRLADEVTRRGVPGAMVDCGTYNGGSTALLSAGAPERPVWAFDSFQGLPEASVRDVILDPDWVNPSPDLETVVGLCHGSEEMVRRAVLAHGTPERLRVRAGWFQDTLPLAREEIGPIAVLHCDSDWYDSVHVTLEHLYPLVSIGGYVVIDDYGAIPGARRATDDYRRHAGDSARLVRVDQTGRYWRKPGPSGR